MLIWKVLAGRTAPQQVFTATAVRGLLVGLGLCSLLGMPTQSPLVLLWFMLLVAWLTVAIANADVPRSTCMASSICIAAALLSVAYAATHWCWREAPCRCRRGRGKSNRPLVTGTYGPEEGPSGEFRWTRGEANFYWPVTDRFVILRLGAQHPDLAQRPVQLTVSTPCGTVLDIPITSPDLVTLGMQMPDGQRMVHWTVKVSRTFRPSDFDGEDRRQLGATVSVDFTDSGDRFREQQHAVVLPRSCSMGTPAPS